MTYLRTDQYTYVNAECPVTIDIHPADHCVEVAIGGSGDTLRLVFHDADVMIRIARAFQMGRNELVAHLDKLAHPGPALSQLDGALTNPIAS